jgi:hypothetical protein
MEWRFFVEAKSFAFSVVEGDSVLRLEEREGLYQCSVLGFQCIAWLVLTVEEFLRNPDVKDFVKSFWEDSKILIVEEAVIRLAGTWRWRLMQWVAEKGLFCFLRVAKGGDGAKLLVS